MSRFLDRLVGLDLPTAERLLEIQAQKLLQDRALEMASQSPEPIELGGLADDSLAQVKIVLKSDNDCNVILEIAENLSTQEEASAIARMLFSLNEGKMKGTFAGIIQQQMLTDVRDTNFGQAIMDAWEQEYAEHDDDCVPPSQALTGAP